MSFGKFKRSTGRFLRKVFHKPKSKISRGSIMLVVTLLIIFTAALLLRVEPLINAQPIVRAFDPWFQLKVTDYVTENGFSAFFTWYDETTWVPFGRDMAITSYVGVPFTSAFFYFLLNGIGIQVDVLTVSLLLPAFMGALTSVVAFFLGRELSNNTVGLFAGIFTAFIPAFITRTAAGFYDNECIGVFAIVLATFLFIRGLKRGSISASIGAGLALGYLQMSWGASGFMLGLLALYAFIMLVMGRYSRRLLTSYLLTISLGIFVGALIPRNGFGNLTDFTTIAPIGIGGLLVLYEIWLRIGGYRETTATALAPHIKPILTGLIVPFVGIGAYLLYSSGTELEISPYNTNPVIQLGSKFLTVINPFVRLDQRILASVAEHLPSPWGSFYNILLILIFFFPLGMYFLFKRGRDEDWLMLVYGLTSVYFAGSMIRLNLILAPGVAILAAVAAYNILAPFAKVVTQKSVFERRRFRMSSSLTSEHALMAFAFVGLLLSVNIILGVQYVENQVGNPEFAQADLSDVNQATDWQTAMTYVRNVLPDDAVIASWWDYGYWINGASDKNTIVDNATFNSTQIAKMGYALMSLNLTESLRTFKDWNTTHVLVYFGHRFSGFGGDEGKWPWMVRIAEDRFGKDYIDDATYLGTNDQTQEAFYQSTLFKLLVYGEPRDQQEAGILGLSEARMTIDDFLWRDTEWISHMPVSLYGAFSGPYYSSGYGTVKIYEIDYTMYDQWLNSTKSDWTLGLSSGNLDINIDGDLTGSESTFPSYSVSFGGGYQAEVYTQSNSTHMYYGIQMDNYTIGDDAFGLQIAPLDSPLSSDLRIVNYNGQDFDGHIRYDGTWAEDSTGTDSSEYATGNNVIEFLIPLDGGDSEDLPMAPGMNYQIRLLFWNNVDHGEPSFTGNWNILWVPVVLH
ncbi:MAG: glycosyltransferase family 39 protein [Candidatus Thorarchaeota archaeon]|nr:glycosyltransferase family 39 protein [Candidatus Thorarchaeota archaeon]